MPPSSDLLQGTLDLLVLQVLTQGTQHGWAISKEIHLLSREALNVTQGSLYPALHRLEDNGDVTAEWRTSDQGRRAKYYALTTQGKRRLKDETAGWRRFSQAVESILIAGEPKTAR
jgi:PadR family transcriptional regulator, regulatory protein PadR